MSLSSLPDEVLKLVLHHVPLNDRLGSCSLVNRRLHAAAVAATDTVLLSSSSNQRADCFLSWLPPYGQHLTHLEVGPFNQPLPQLQCPNLQHLKLTWFRVQLGPIAGSYPGVLHDLTKLTYLNVTCDLIDAPEGAVLDCLPSLVHLQHLHVLPYDSGTRRMYSLGGFSSGTLPRLTQLTYLQFRGFSVENLGQLGGLPDLQDLVLAAADDSIAVGPSIVPGLALPATLKQVWLRNTAEAELLSLLPAGLTRLDVNAAVEGPAEGPKSLLSCMTHLQHLVELEVCLDEWPPAGPAYSALTASSSLASLGMHQHNLPEGVWPHVFPATRKLPHLTYIQFGHADLLEVPSAWGAEDMCFLIDCCPHLQGLYGMCLQLGPHVSELHKLSALTSLDVKYESAEVEAALERSLKGLVAITQLNHLGIILERDSVGITSLLPLTSLTALTSLRCDWHDDHLTSLCSLDKEPGSGPDVWLQLLERCALHLECAPTVLSDLAQRLAEQRALVRHQQQALEEQGARIAALEGQLQQALAAAGVQQQQQLSGQQQVVAEQGARIAVLEGQLQALLQRFPPS